MGTFTAASLKPQSDGSYGRVDCLLTATGTYNNTGSDATTGDTLTAASVGLSNIISVTILDDAGYTFEPLGLDSGPATSCRLKIYQGASGTSGSTSGGTPAGTNATSAVTGTGTFTPTAPTTSLDLTTPAFSGTGFATAGQVITTTENKTMTLNECAGMWFINTAQAATLPTLILSNTAVTGAPAVLTTQGTPPATDAGAWVIVKNVTQAGTVSALNGTAAAQVFTGSALAGHTHTIGAAAGGEVPNGTDLTTPLAAVRVTISGY